MICTLDLDFDLPLMLSDDMYVTCNNYCSRNIHFRSNHGQTENKTLILTGCTSESH